MRAIKSALMCASTLVLMVPKAAVGAPATYEGCLAIQQSAGRQLHVTAVADGGGLTAQSPMSLERALKVAHSGDTIYLADGDYGLVHLEGRNAGFVTLTSEPGQHPKLEGLKIGGYNGASYWDIENIYVSGPRPAGLTPSGWQNHPFLVEVNNSSDIIIHNNIIETVPGDYGWAPEIQGKSLPEQLMSGIAVQNSSCVALRYNKIHNVFNGIAVGGDQSNGRGTKLLVSRNEITEFAGDGIDHFGSHVAITSNIIENAHDECKDLCIHNDGIQGWNYNNRADVTNSDVFIDGNTIIDRTNSVMLQPADDLHGITIFDGNWENVRIQNNVILTVSWHGISIYGVRGATVLNNTVISPDPRRAAWILIHVKKGENFSGEYPAVVRNNIASSINIDPKAQGVVADHNLLGRDPRRLFAVFDPDHRNYDLHLSATSPAIGAGVDVTGLSDDIQGHKRVGRYDIGAYVAASSP